ncbi:Uncharacterised protein [Burkholderia pseudomallei]|nr:Uncharacterised protein [Burkholderia pseudomallei]CPJ20647.1 Uncharacterised protein [Burkholderia pseudomallei]
MPFRICWYAGFGGSGVRPFGRMKRLIVEPSIGSKPYQSLSVPLGATSPPFVFSGYSVGASMTNRSSSSMRSHSSHVCSLSGIWKKSVSCLQRSSGFFFGSRGLNFHFSAARLSFSFSMTSRRMSQLSASARS